MNISQLQPVATSLPAVLAGDGGPSSLTAALDAAQIQVAAIQSVSKHAHDRMTIDIQNTGMDLLLEVNRDKWHHQFVTPLHQRADVVHDRLSEYQDKLQHLPEILPAWTAVIARLAHMVTVLEALLLELERRTDVIFDAEVTRRRAAGLPVGDHYDENE